MTEQGEYDKTFRCRLPGSLYDDDYGPSYIMWYHSTEELYYEFTEEGFKIMGPYLPLGYQLIIE